jgi:hypothetical protein
LFAELGIDENLTTVNEVMEDEDTRYLMAEMSARAFAAEWASRSVSSSPR